MSAFALPHASSGVPQIGDFSTSSQTFCSGERSLPSRMFHLALGERLRLLLRYPMATLLSPPLPSPMTLGQFLSQSCFPGDGPGTVPRDMELSDGLAEILPAATAALAARATRLWHLFQATLPTALPPLPMSAMSPRPLPLLSAHQMISDLAFVPSPELVAQGARLAALTIRHESATGNRDQALELTEHLWLAAHVRALRQRQLETTAHLLELPRMIPATTDGNLPGQWYTGMVRHGERLLSHLTAAVRQSIPAGSWHPLEAVFSPLELRRESRLHARAAHQLDTTLQALEADGLSGDVPVSPEDRSPFACELEFEIITTRFFLAAARYSRDELACLAGHLRPAAADLMAHGQAATHPSTGHLYEQFVRRHGTAWLRLWLTGFTWWLSRTGAAGTDIFFS